MPYARRVPHVTEKGYSLPLYLGERTDLLTKRAIPVSEGASGPEQKVSFS
jgi:hypothetical protein